MRSPPSLAKLRLQLSNMNAVDFTRILILCMLLLVLKAGFETRPLALVSPLAC